MLKVLILCTILELRALNVIGWAFVVRSIYGRASGKHHDFQLVFLHDAMSPCSVKVQQRHASLLMLSPTFGPSTVNTTLVRRFVRLAICAVESQNRVNAVGTTLPRLWSCATIAKLVCNKALLSRGEVWQKIMQDRVLS